MRALQISLTAVATIAASVIVTTLALWSAPAQAQSAAVMDEFQQGTEALHANQPDQAVQLFTKITQEAPRFAEAFLNLGLAQALQGRNEDAVAALQTALAIKPTLHGANLFLAISQYRLNHFAQASIAIRKETERSPRDAQAWMWQGIIDLASAHLTDAVDALNKAAKIDPKNVDILYHLGHAAFELSRQNYEEMFRIDPQSWHVHQVLAQSDVEAGKDADAIEQYRLAIAAAPPQSGLHEALATALWRTGKFADAEAEFESALKIDPADIISTYKLGCLRVDLSKGAEAKPLLAEVLQTDPSLRLARYYLARAEMQLGNMQEAIAGFREVIATNADPETTRQAYVYLARVYRRLHQDSAAEAAQTEYRRLDQASREHQEDLLQKRRERYDRDTRLPASPDADAAPQ